MVLPGLQREFQGGHAGRQAGRQVGDRQVSLQTYRNSSQRLPITSIANWGSFKVINHFFASIIRHFVPLAVFSNLCQAVK